MSDYCWDSVPHELEAALADVCVERGYQAVKWGETDHRPTVWMAILGKQVGQAAVEALAAELGSSDAVKRLRTELVQVAAVAVAAIEALDREKWPDAPATRGVPRAETRVDEHGVLHVDVFAPPDITAVRPSIITVKGAR